MTQKQRNVAMYAIRWTIDNYPEIAVMEKYGKEPKLGLLCDEFEKHFDVIFES